jgi:ABC-2 type transport system permease protein
LERIKIKRKLNILKAVAAATIKEYIVYRTHMLISLFVGPVYFAVQYFIWGAVYGDDAVIMGIEYTQMIRYFGITALIGYLTWGSADWNLSMLIRTGRFLTFALRPIHHRFFALSQKIGHRLLAFGMEFIPCTLIFMLLFGVNMFPANIGWFVISVILASVIHFFISYCIGMFSFWFVQSHGLRMAYFLVDSIFAGALIPLVFFPMPLQFIQFFLPFQYTSYVPAMVFLGEYRLGGYVLSVPAIVGIQAIAVVVMYTISEIMYRIAMKRFTDVGA